MTEPTPMVTATLKSDPVNHPPHYNSSPAKCSNCAHPIECIDVIKHMPLPTGTAIKYLWREGLKDDKLQDLRKSLWYVQCAIDLEIERRAEAAKEEQSA